MQCPGILYVNEFRHKAIAPYFVLIPFIVWFIAGCTGSSELEITTPSQGTITSAHELHIQGRGQPGEVIQLSLVTTDADNNEVYDMLETASIGTDGSWHVLDVPLVCGANVFEATETGTGNKTEKAKVIRVPEPPGPYVDEYPAVFVDATSFSSDDKLIATYYFYWYDAAADTDSQPGINTHMQNRIHHEIDENPTVFTWRNLDWHKRHLRDMSAARIDIVLPVYWGVPCEKGYGYENHWSTEGLKRIVEASERLLDEGIRTPKIGMLYDTLSLGVGTDYVRSHPASDLNWDLTELSDVERFYLPIRDFFSLVPPKHWAMIDDKPIVWLYNTHYVSDYNGETISYIKRRFAEDFGDIEPYVIRESSWKDDKMKLSGEYVTDNAYTWGTSLYGYDRIHTIASFGPGYDESAIPERYCQGQRSADPECVPCEGENVSDVGCPRKRDRANGVWYETQWQRALAERDQVSIVALEVWNEYHEGNSIGETREFGRKYIELTSQYATVFSPQPPNLRPLKLIASASPTPRPTLISTSAPELVQKVRRTSQAPNVMVINQSSYDITINAFNCIVGDLNVQFPPDMVRKPGQSMDYPRGRLDARTCDVLINAESANPISLHFDLEPYHQYRVTITDASLQKGASATSLSLPPDGRWEGTVSQPKTQPYSTVMTLNACGLHTKCGSIDYPELNCGGTLSFLGIEEERYRFREEIAYGRERCVTEGLITVQLNDDGTWTWVWYFVDHGQQGAHATLTKTR